MSLEQLTQTCACKHTARPALLTVPVSFRLPPGGFGVQPWEWRCLHCRKIMAYPETHYCQGERP